MEIDNEEHNWLYEARLLWNMELPSNIWIFTGFARDQS